MKILYTDTYLHALNPTNTLMSAMVSTAAEVSFFGPGYVSGDELTSGIERFIDATGPYDALVLGPNVPVVDDPKDWPIAIAYMQRFAALAPDAESIFEYLKNLFTALPKISIPIKVATLVALDNYGSQKAQIDRLLDLGVYILAPDSSFAERIEKLPPWLFEEKHYKRKKERLSNAWIDFVTENSARVLSSLHFVAESEFYFRAIEQRKTIASVPGAEYFLRREARGFLKRNGIKTGGKLLFNTYRLLSKFRLPVYSNFLPLRIFNTSYQENLLDTRFVYTARGGFGLPVRKFFEIPAAGAVMICIPPLGFAEMGFVDGVHYLEAEPKDSPELILELSRDIGRAQTIASNAQKLVWQSHTLTARGVQLRKCLESIRAGTYLGSRWRQGKFEVEERAL
jgi:hypothetical protein